MNNKTKKMTFMCILVAQALVLFIVESMIPIPFIAPGAKLGLANIVTVIALYTLSLKETITIIFLRLILSMFFGGNVSMLMYSLSGAILSLIIMLVIKNLLKNKVSIIGVSCAGAVFHNVGQIIVAASIVNTFGVTFYLPILTIVGIFTGFFVGVTSNYVLKHLKKLKIATVNF